jgi:hypothetical protein
VDWPRTLSLSAAIGQVTVPTRGAQNRGLVVFASGSGYGHLGRRESVPV